MISNKTYAPVAGIGGLIEELFQNSRNSFWNEDHQNGKHCARVPVNIREAEHAFSIEVIAPGYQREDFNIAITDNLLTIATEAPKTDEANPEKFIRKEFTKRAFKRSFTLTDKVEPTQIVAKYADGILVLTVPKKEPVAPSSITVSVA